MDENNRRNIVGLSACVICAIGFASAVSVCRADTEANSLAQSAESAPTPTPPVKPATAHGKAKKAAKKKEEPEDEWVLLPEPVKKASQPDAASAASMPVPAVASASAAQTATTANPVDATAATAQTATAQTAAAQPQAEVAPTERAQPPAVAVSTTELPPAASTSQSQATIETSSPPTPAATPGVEQRLALVIGNSNYAVGHLPNSLNDAQSIAAMLKDLGWQVIELENVGKDEMSKAAENFGNRLASGGGVGLFYYAGHGIQSSNLNYLIPVDADIQDEDELPAHAYESSDVLHRMDRANNRLNIVILDACRNNPFASRFSSVTKGLAGAQPGSTTAMIISYATQPGATAADGTSGNGLYTSELLHAMSQQGLGVEEVFKEVRSEVKKKSGNKQIPYEASSLTTDFYFNPTPEQAALQPMLASNNGAAVASGQSRSIAPVLVSRKLFENYQLSADLPLPATLAVARFYADGSSFFTVTKDHSLRVWDVGTGTIISTQPDFGVPSLSDDGRYLLGRSDAYAVHLLDTDTKTSAVKAFQISNEIQAAGISPDARRLLLYTKERGFILMDTTKSAPVGDARKVDGDPQFAFSPSGTRVLLWGSKSSDLYLWDTETGKRVRSLSAHIKPVGLVRFSKDGNLLLSAADGDSAIVWQATTGTELHKLAQQDPSALPIQAEFIDGGKRVLMNTHKPPVKTGEAGYTLGIWEVNTGKFASSFPTNTMVKSLRFSPDEQRLFVTGPDNSTRVFDMATKTQVDALNGAELIGFSADGRRLIAHDGDGIRLYETRGLTPISRMPGQITAFLASRASNLYATAAADGSVRLIDFETGDTVSILRGHIDPVTTVSFAPDGKRLVTFSDEKTAKLWALPSVRDVKRLAKDSFESSAEYQKRVADWTSDYTTLVMLGDYNADAEAYTVKVGDFALNVPMPRDDARHLAGQREAILSGKLKFYNAEQLQLADIKLNRIP